MSRTLAVLDPNLPWHTVLKDMAYHASAVPLALGNSWLYRALMRENRPAARDWRNY